MRVRLESIGLKEFFNINGLEEGFNSMLKMSDTEISRICLSAKGKGGNAPLIGVSPKYNVMEEDGAFRTAGVNKINTIKMLSSMYRVQDIVPEIYWTEEMISSAKESNLEAEIKRLNSEYRGDQIMDYYIQLGLGWSLEAGGTIEVELPERYVEEVLRYKGFVANGMITVMSISPKGATRVIEGAKTEREMVELEDKPLDEIKAILKGRGIKVEDGTSRLDMIKVIKADMVRTVE